MIESFVSFASRLDPSFVQRIEGASPPEIEAYQKLCGRSLPEDYRGFLGRMGRCAGGLTFLAECISDLPDLIQYHQETVGIGELVLDPDHILIAFGGMGGEMVGLDLSAASGPHPVISLCDGERTGVWAESLEKLLHRVAFRQLRVLRAPHRWRGSSADPTPRLSRIVEQFRALGFREEPFNEANVISLTHPAGAMQARQSPGGGLAVEVGADDPELAARIGAQLTRDFGLTPL